MVSFLILLAVMSALVRSYKMEIIKDEKTGLEFVFITNEDGTTLSMLKSTYDAQQAAQSTLVTESAPTA